jgi:hypothetical protein
MSAEKNLRARIRDSLKMQEVVWGGLLTHWSVADSYTAGMPDMMACLDGHLYALELKAEKGVLSEIQKFILRNMARAGATAGVIREDREAPLGFHFERITPEGAINPPEYPATSLWLGTLREVPSVHQ